MQIIGKSGHRDQYIHLSAHRETHLKSLEAFAKEQTGKEYEVSPEINMVIADANHIERLIWTLELKGAI